MPTAAVILAAGQGTRMGSDLPKVLHTVAGRPMVAWVIDAVRRAGVARAIVVVGYQGERVEQACAGEGVEIAWQHEQLGTGHAVQQTEPLLREFDGHVLVLNGDVPGLRPDTIGRLVEHHRETGASATVLTARLDDPTGYGRIVRDEDGALLRIVEHRDADEETRAIDEVNTGMFCFERAPLFDALARLDRNNAQGEYYVTDVIDHLRRDGRRVSALCVDDAREVAGVNTPAELEAVRRWLETQ